LIGVDKYGSLSKPEVALVFDIAATEEQVRMVNEMVEEEAQRKGVDANSIEWSIELSEMTLARKYDAGEYPHRACLRSLSKAHIEIIEDFQEIDLGHNQSYKSLSQSFLATSMVLFIITVGVISVSIVLSFRHTRGQYNMVVLKESNKKLDGLLYLLAYSLDQLRNPEDGFLGWDKNKLEAAKSIVMGVPMKFTPRINVLDSKIKDADGAQDMVIGEGAMDESRRRNGRAANGRLGVDHEGNQSHQNDEFRKDLSLVQRMTLMSFGKKGESYQELPENREGMSGGLLAIYEAAKLNAKAKGKKLTRGQIELMKR